MTNWAEPGEVRRNQNQSDGSHGTPLAKCAKISPSITIHNCCFIIFFPARRDDCCAAACVASRENAKGIPLIEKGLDREQDLSCVLEALLVVFQSDQFSPSYHEPGNHCTQPSTRQPDFDKCRVHIKKNKPNLASHIHVFDDLTLGRRHDASRRGMEYQSNGKLAANVCLVSRVTVCSRVAQSRLCPALSSSPAVQLGARCRPQPYAPQAGAPRATRQRWSVFGKRWRRLRRSPGLVQRRRCLKVKLVLAAHLPS